MWSQMLMTRYLKTIKQSMGSRRMHSIYGGSLGVLWNHLMLQVLLKNDTCRAYGGAIAIAFWIPGLGLALLRTVYFTGESYRVAWLPLATSNEIHWRNDGKPKFVWRKTLRPFNIFFFFFLFVFFNTHALIFIYNNFYIFKLFL